MSTKLFGHKTIFRSLSICRKHGAPGRGGVGLRLVCFFFYFPLRHDFSTTLFPHLLPLFPFAVRELGGCAWTGFQAGLSHKVLQEGQVDTDHVQRLKACFSAPFPGLVFDPHHNQGFPVMRTSNLFRNILNSCNL